MKIELTETEITHIMDALDGRVEDLRDTLALGADPMIEDEIAELTELSMDLFEALNRPDPLDDSTPQTDPCSTPSVLRSRLRSSGRRPRPGCL